MTESAHRPRLHRDPPTQPPLIDYAQMADDYGGISSADFNAKYGDDWYEHHHAGLIAAIIRRQAHPQRLNPDPLDVQLTWPTHLERPPLILTEEPIRHEFAILGVGVCIGFVLGVLVGWWL